MVDRDSSAPATGLDSTPSTLLDLPWLFQRELDGAMPSLRPTLEALVDSLPSFVTFVHGAAQSPRAIGTIITQATNDFADVLFDIHTGRGRSAITATRTLFELLVS